MAATPLLESAFAHHAWATITLIEACEDLSPEALQHVVPGTRGPIIQTLAHIVDGDTWDLDLFDGRSLAEAAEAGLELSALRAAAERNAARWSSFLSTSPDPGAMVTEVDPADGFRRVAPIDLRLAAALSHGSDHRSQICTALSTLGVRPPAIDVWTFGVGIGRIEETPGTS
jgi:uncharacterized damage-inducible protein DinB